MMDVTARPDMDRERLLAEMARYAARRIVEDGLDYGQARRDALAAYDAGHGRLRDALTNERIEDEVRAHIDLFCADTQPAELEALRRAARRWMSRLAAFRPHVAGAVWRGTATRQSVVRIDLFADDPKAPEHALIDAGVEYETHSEPARGGGEPALGYVVAERSRELDDWITVALQVHDADDLRGALKPDARGQTWRGDLRALDALLDAPGPTPEGTRP
jgi:hypothetical protein